MTWQEDMALRSSEQSDVCCLTCSNYELHGYGDIGTCFCVAVMLERPPIVREYQVCRYHSPRWPTLAKLARTIQEAGR